MPLVTIPAATATSRADQMDRTLLSRLRPAMIGPRADLHRYAVSGEKTGISLGAYDNVTATTYDYPGRTDPLSTIDLSYVKLYADVADLNYFNKYVGSNGSAMPSSTYPNRVRADSYVFKTANGTSRSADFYDRDVKVGDIVTLHAVVSSVDYTLSTTVTGFVGEPVAASVAAATADANDKATQTESATIDQVAGTPVNDVVAVADGTAYESTADGYITRTYTITVTQGSSNGNATTALLRVRSADGLDNADNVVPAAFTSPTAIGSKGLKVTFSTNPANSSTSGTGVAQDDFLVGQQWTVTVSQAFTAPVATSAGTYTGVKNDTYIVTVSRGGLYSATTKPQITVTTANGSDASGPTTITAAATPVAVGNYGVTVAFNSDRLRKGDVYYIVVTAASEGAIRTLVLKDDVPTVLRGIEVDLRLFARRNGVLIHKNRTLPTAAANWSNTATTVTVENGIYLTDSEFTNGGALVGIPLSDATLYLEYREWVTTGSGTLISVSAIDQVAAKLGTVDPDNPVAYATAKALANTDGELAGDPARPAATTTDIVYAVPLGGDPATEGLWTSALNVILDNDFVYQIVPLTTDATVRTAVAAHVAAQSADTAGFYRVAWLAASVNETGAVVSAATTSDGLPVTATIGATPGITPTVYTTVTASATALFVTKGVRVGDSVRINFGTDADGNQTYDSYLVAAVVSETTLTLASGPTGPVSPARQIEVWRTYTKDELVTQITGVAASFASERIRYVWPDTVGFGGTILAGYNLCAALAGLAGSCPSHQGLRNVTPVGFDAAPRSASFFTSSQLEKLAAGGVFVVTQTPGGTVYVKSAVTTDPSSLATREEMVVRNADMIRQAIQNAWAPYVGAGNVTSNLQNLLTGALKSLVNKIKTTAFTPTLGPVLADLRLTSLAAVPGMADAVSVTITPYGLAVPLNTIQLTLPVSV